MARKEKKYHFIYKTTNLLSGKYYIGMHSTNNLDDGYLGSGNRIRRSIKKYGADNFSREILEFVDNRVLLAEREEEIVNLDEIAKEKCMNLVVGGSGGFTVEQWKKGAKKMNEIIWSDPEFIKRKKLMSSKIMKQCHKDGKIKYDNFTGKKHSDETKKIMSDSSKGSGSGSTNSQFGSCWITNGEESKKMVKGDIIPDGWRLGRKMK